MFPRRISGVTATGGLIAVLAIGATGCGSSGGGGTSTSGGGASPKIAFLLPENKTARYEAQDKPDFIAGVKHLCSQCRVLYNNANQMLVETRGLLKAVREDPKKYLSIKLHIF